MSRHRRSPLALAMIPPRRLRARRPATTAGRPWSPRSTPCSSSPSRSRVTTAVVDLTAPGVEPHDLRAEGAPGGRDLGRRRRRLRAGSRRRWTRPSTRTRRAAPSTWHPTSTCSRRRPAPPAEARATTTRTSGSTPLLTRRGGEGDRGEAGQGRPGARDDFRPTWRDLDSSSRPSTTSTPPGCRLPAPTFVISHDAFGYWRRYGVESAPIAGLSPDAEPAPHTSTSCPP